MELSTKKCEACRGDSPAMSEKEAANFLKHTPDWKLIENGKKIRRDFQFKNFVLALDFTNKVGALAEEEGHHPDIELGWGYCNVTIFTHKIQGLHENDFILAAKINDIDL